MTFYKIIKNKDLAKVFYYVIPAPHQVRDELQPESRMVYDLGVLCGKAVFSLVVRLLRFEDEAFKKLMVRGPSGRILLFLFDPT